MEPDYSILRNRMIEQQLKTRNITSEAVLRAMEQVPRHLFVPKHLVSHAYDDSPLPIGQGQTISQPYIVAYMTEQLELAAGMKVLEIGTGSGYQTAILAQLGCRVYTIELLDDLAEKAGTTLAELGFDNVTIRHGSGYMGWPSAAPFDAIIVTAAPEALPPMLLEQLAEGGRMIVPVGTPHSVQQLKLITKWEGRLIENNLLPVAFVPMVE